MTDKEIIKNLECCTNDDDEPNCKECTKRPHIYCMCELLEEALDLIKRQQERIEDLEALAMLKNKRHYYNRFIKEVWQVEHGELSYPDFDEIYKQYFELKEHLDRIVEQLEALAEDARLDYCPDSKYRDGCIENCQLCYVFASIKIVKGVQNE